MADAGRLLSVLQAGRVRGLDTCFNDRCLLLSLTHSLTLYLFSCITLFFSLPPSHFLSSSLYLSPSILSLLYSPVMKGSVTKIFLLLKCGQLVCVCV